MPLRTRSISSGLTRKPSAVSYWFQLRCRIRLSFFCRRAISSAADNINWWRNALVNLNFVCKCIEDTIDGLQDGLSHFSGSSRVAVIYAITPDDPMRIYDPQNLLRGHEPIFEELNLVSGDRYDNIRPSGEIMKFQHMVPEKNLELAGLISWGGRSSSVFYQMWFTEHHPDMCSIGPTECWLEHAAWRFSLDIANEEELYTGISGSFLSEYSTHAVRDYVVDQMNVILGWDTLLRIYPILDAVLGISRTREEGQWPVGELIFSDVRSLPELEFFARFPEMGQPDLTNFKHVRKLLLSVEDSDRRLVSEGKTWNCQSPWPKSMVPCTSAPTHACTDLPACWMGARFPVKIVPAGRDITRPCGSPPSMTTSSWWWFRRIGRFP